MHEVGEGFFEDRRRRIGPEEDEHAQQQHHVLVDAQLQHLGHPLEMHVAFLAVESDLERYRIREWTNRMLGVFLFPMRDSTVLSGEQFLIKIISILR